MIAFIYFLMGMAAAVFGLVGLSWLRILQSLKRVPAKRFDKVETLTWELKLNDLRVDKETSLTIFAREVAYQMDQTLKERPFNKKSTVTPGLYRAYITVKATLTKWEEP